MGGSDRFKVDIPDDVAEDAPFVVVCGWHGARDKHVRKYTDALTRLGCGTLRCIQPGALVFSPFSAPRAAYVRDMLTAVRATRAKYRLTGPLYLMFMSNGGCFLHASMTRTRALTPDGSFADLDAVLAGCIFDSCPAYMSVASGVGALTHGMSFVPRALCTLGFFLGMVALVLASMLTTGGLDALPPRVFWRTMREAKGRRELYLYSDSDHLTDAEKLAELIDERRREVEGCDVTEVRWAQSRHCTHLVDKRKEYLQAVTTFLKGPTPSDGGG